MGRSITYREIDRHKYALLEPAETQTALRPSRRIAVEGDWVILGMGGLLVARAGYTWNGASGPAFDTPSFLRGSLHHDQLYQLMRERLLPPWNRKAADEELRRICLEDGMSAFRAGYVYSMVRAFGGRAARPWPTSKPLRLTAP